MTKKRIILIFLLAIVGLIGLSILFIVVQTTLVGELSWPPFRPPRGETMATGGNLHSLCMDILYFHDKMGRYPDSLKELRDWIGIVDNDDRRADRFFDGWRRPTKYVIENPKLNVGKFDLYSVGKNGIDEYDKSDFGDDIHVLADDAGVSYPQNRR
ncbi:MAG: hypothetical protein ACYS30_09650 [Planctomycetota bacterium]|jgi:hypothetical protein